MGLSSLAQIDSLVQVLPLQDGKEKSLTWVNLTRAYVMQGQDSLAYQEGLRGLNYITSLGDTATMAQMTYYLHFAASSKTERLSWLIKSEAYSVHLRKPFQRYIREALVIEFQDRANFKEALRLASENVTFSKSIEDTLSILESVLEQGYTLDRMKSYTEAIPIYESVIPMAEQFNDLEILGRAQGLIGIAYDELQEYEQAKFYNRQAIAYFREARKENENSASYLATWLSNLGNTLTKTKEFEAAEEALNESLDIRKTLGQNAPTAVGHINLGKLLMDMGRLPEAKTHLKQGLRLANEFDHVRFQSEGHNRLAEYFTRTGNVDSSIYHLEQYHLLNDSIISADKVAQIADLQVFYETAEKEQENQLLQQKNDILLLEHERQRFWLFGSIALVFLVSLASFFAYRVRKAREAGRVQAKIIEERERGIKVMIQSVEEERQRIAKDLHDGIGQQMTALKLKWTSLKEKTTLSETEGPVAEISNLIDNTGKDIRAVSHQMMPRALMELGLVPALRDMIEQSLDAAETPYQFEVLGKERRLPQAIEVGLFRVTQELINNILKHANAAHVDVQLFFRNDSLILTIEDDGVGLAAKKEDGVGMLNIFSRVSALKGEARYEDGSSKGTLAVIKIPISEGS
jgi:signal transduction histidine kinase